MTNIVHSVNGKLAGTQTPQKVKEMILAAKNTENRLLLYFHGGLVSQNQGDDIAKRLNEDFSKSGVTPVFNVWNSGKAKSFVDSLDEIVTQVVTKILLKRVERILRRQSALSAGALSVPSIEAFDFSLIDREVDSRFDAMEGNEFVETGIGDVSGMHDLSAEEQAAWQDVLARDDELLRALAELRPNLRSALTMHADNDVNRFEAALFGVWDVVQVAARVISRFRRGRDHGVHATIAEELVRQFGFGAAEAIWSTIKGYTSNAFEPGGVGHVLLDGIADLVSGASGAEVNVKVYLVGHSAGAVYISRFIAAAHRRGIPVQFDVILLAPAVSIALWNKVIVEDGGAALVRGVRIFTMTDRAERDDAMLWFSLYPHSLLYFVSGVCEETADEPLLGLQRHHSEARQGPYESIRAVRETRAYLDGVSSKPVRVWADKGHSGPAGATSTATKHGKFDEDDATLNSIKHILKSGF